jgi:hypothetical protein
MSGIGGRISLGDNVQGWILPENLQGNSAYVKCTEK